MTTYYRPVDLTEVPLRVVLRMMRGQHFTVAYLATAIIALRKLVRWPFPARWGQTWPEKLTPTVLEWDELPAEVRLAMEPRAAQCRNYGLTLALCSKPSYYIGRMRGYSATFLDATQTTAATVLWRQLYTGREVKTRIWLICSSELSDGRRLVTLTEDPSPLGNLFRERVDVEHLPPDTPTGEVLATHRRRLETVGVSAIAEDKDTIIAKTLERLREEFEHLVASGILVPLSQKEAARLIRDSWN